MIKVNTVPDPIKKGKSKNCSVPPCTLDAVALCFQKVHQSSSEVYRRKKELIELWKHYPLSCASCISAVVVLVLKQTPQLPIHVLKRHYDFLESVAKSCLEEPILANEGDSREVSAGGEGPVYKDQVAIQVIQSLIPFHNANDKTVRLAVVTIVEILLKAVDSDNTSDARQDLYQKLAENLKLRIHDRCPQVRERAVAAVAPFQLGKRECDVTQQLLALLCSDPFHEVRRQVLKSIMSKKEYLDGYFHGMIRSTSDVAPRVRAEAWDALGRFPWRYITAYCAAKSVQMPLQLHRGLTDVNSSVAIACRSAMVNSWLHRDCKGECETFLDPILAGYAFQSLEPYEMISACLYRSWKQSHSTTNITLRLTDIRTSSLLMWKADCKAMSERVEDEDDPERDVAASLLPLSTFTDLLDDTVNCYTRPDAKMKVATFRTPDDADNMLRIILSMLEIYQEDGYLAHADNTTRHSLLKTIGVLLMVVPDVDPSMFVHECISSLKSLTARTPDEASSTVTCALSSLFGTLKLPQRYKLEFDDVEAFGRKSRERQQELIKMKVLLNSNRCSEEDYYTLKSEVAKDGKFLLRIQHIVWSYLSNSHQGEEVPTFCTHVIQLGRHSDIEMAHIIAIKSLGMQCLIRPETVHTFMPVLLTDATLNARGEDESLPVAAIGVVVDLIMEYGLNFFRVHSRSKVKRESEELEMTECISKEGRAATDQEDEDEERGSNGQSIDACRQYERALPEEDHKVGSQYLQELTISYLHPSSRPVSHTMIMGFCKLLGANRLPKERVPLVLSFLLLHFNLFQSTRKTDCRSDYMATLMTRFFKSYSSSHPRRQADFMMGGMAAVRFLLQYSANPKSIQTFLIFLLRCGDAFHLSDVRSIDPEVAQRVRQDDKTLDGSTVGTVDGDASRTSSNRSSSSNISLRSSAARSSMQSGRLLKELSRHSQHERAAEHLLLFVQDPQLSLSAKSVCVDTLEKHMYFYSREPQPFLHFASLRALGFLAQHEKESKECEILRERLQSWLNELETRFQFFVSSPAASPSGRSSGTDLEENIEQQPLFDRALALQKEMEVIVKELINKGALEFPCCLNEHTECSTTIRTDVPSNIRIAVKTEPLEDKPVALRKRSRGEQRTEECSLGSDPFGVESIIGPSWRKRAKK